MKKIFIICCILGLLCGKANAITNADLLKHSEVVYNDCNDNGYKTEYCLAIARTAELLEMYKLSKAQVEKALNDIPVCVVSYPDLKADFEICIYKVVRSVILGSK